MTTTFTRRSLLRLVTAAAAPGLPEITFAQAPDAEPPALPDRAAVLKAANEGFDLLDKLYWSPVLKIWLDRPGDDLRAFYEGRLNPPWWSCANAVEAIIDLAAITGDKSRLPALAELHDLHGNNPDHAPAVEAELKRRGQWKTTDKPRPKNRPRNSTKAGYKNFTNEYLDDSGWWGIAWLKMHHATGEPRYLETARAVHAHMAAHRLPDGGGVMWNLEHAEKKANAISNGLFLVLSARLHKTTGEAAFLKDALDTKKWYLEKGLYDGIGIVDAPGHKDDHWTYNQGIWIDGLLALSETTGDPTHADEAARFTGTLLEKGNLLTPDGVIIEKLSSTGWDTALFKGVFARSLDRLRRTSRIQKSNPLTTRRVDRALMAGAASLLAGARDGAGLYGMQWQKKPINQEWNFNSHLSALMLLESSLLPANNGSGPVKPLRGD